MSEFRKPPDHNKRMDAARARAQWELGSASWANVILDAYMRPDEDAQALKADQEDISARA